MKLSEIARQLDAAHARGFAAGMAVAAGICVSAFDAEVEAEEILGAADLTTAEKLKAAGADDYDIELLSDVLAHMKQKRKRPSPPAQPLLKEGD